MKIAHFDLTPEELGRELTRQHHRTLYYLASNDYITAEAYWELIGNTLVTPVKNDPNITRKLLDKLFGKDSSEISYVFPIVDISNDPTLNKEEKGKPNLRLIKDDD